MLIGNEHYTVIPISDFLTLIDMRYSLFDIQSPTVNAQLIHSPSKLALYFL
jgi:hypothetical protein